MSGLSSLSADANSSVLNSRAPASSPVFTFRAPQLELPLFSDNSQNDIAFNEFKLSFDNALQGTPNMASSQKFIFLLFILCGRALSLLQQCACTEDGDSFSTAWELLEEEFLTKEVLVNSSLEKFLSSILKTLEHIQNFLTFIRFKEVELRTLEIAFPGEKEEYLGNTLLSYLVRSKLPHFFPDELSRKTDRPSPSFWQFLAFGEELICRLRNNRKVSPLNSSPPPAPLPLRTPKPGETSGAQAVYSCKFCLHVQVLW